MRKTEVETEREREKGEREDRRTRRAKRGGWWLRVADGRSGDAALTGVRQRAVGVTVREMWVVGGRMYR